MDTSDSNRSTGFRNLEAEYARLCAHVSDRREAGELTIDQARAELRDLYITYHVRAEREIAPPSREPAPDPEQLTLWA